MEKAGLFSVSIVEQTMGMLWEHESESVLCYPDHKPCMLEGPFARFLGL